APTVKRVTQELGGKSANIILDDADIEQTVAAGVQGCVLNTGQSCNAPTRMLVPRAKMAQAAAAAKAAAEAVTVGNPAADGIANDTPYGLSGYVTSGDLERARRVAKRIRSGNVHVNGAQPDLGSAFGGYKQSGNGREWGEAGLGEFLELKAVFGYAAG